MAPIHDTDVAEERWIKAGWENYELWERVEQRFKRQRRIWIFLTYVVFIALSAIPIVIDRWPKWSTRAITRKLALQINLIKKEAILSRSAYRIRFKSDEKLEFVVEKLSSCSSNDAQLVRTVSDLETGPAGTYSRVTMSTGSMFEIPGIADEFCYDHLTGNGSTLNGKNMIGFAVIPAKDLTEKRLDRMSVMILSGTSAEISFD